MRCAHTGSAILWHCGHTLQLPPRRPVRPYCHERNFPEIFVTRELQEFLFALRSRRGLAGWLGRISRKGGGYLHEHYHEGVWVLETEEPTFRHSRRLGTVAGFRRGSRARTERAAN